MAGRQNPYAPEPWERNGGIAKLTEMFAKDIPTLGEVATATTMLTSSNPFAIRFGQQPSQSFGKILMGVRAANTQRQNQVDELLMNQQLFEFNKQKLAYKQHRDALEIVRSQAAQGAEASQEVFRELMDILPKLDNASATRVMENLINDPRAVEDIQDPVEAYRFMAQVLSASGIQWREKRGRVVKGKVAAKPKIKSSKIERVNVNGKMTTVSTNVYTDGSVEIVDSMTGKTLASDAAISSIDKEDAASAPAWTPPGANVTESGQLEVPAGALPDLPPDPEAKKKPRQDIPVEIENQQGGFIQQQIDNLFNMFK